MQIKVFAFYHVLRPLADEVKCSQVLALGSAFRETLTCEVHPEKDDRDDKGFKAMSHAGRPRPPGTFKSKKKMLMEPHDQLTYLPPFILHSSEKRTRIPYSDRRGRFQVNKRLFQRSSVQQGTCLSCQVVSCPAAASRLISNTNHWPRTQGV